MAKKYLSLEEAAGMLGISEDELKRAREKGDIRGFADRGNWKFRQNEPSCGPSLKTSLLTVPTH